MPAFVSGRRRWAASWPPKRASGAPDAPVPVPGPLSPILGCSRRMPRRKRSLSVLRCGSQLSKKLRIALCFLPPSASAKRSGCAKAGRELQVSSKAACGIGGGGTGGTGFASSAPPIGKEVCVSESRRQGLGADAGAAGLWDVTALAFAAGLWNAKAGQDDAAGAAGGGGRGAGAAVEGGGAASAAAPCNSASSATFSLMRVHDVKPSHQTRVSGVMPGPLPIASNDASLAKLTGPCCCLERA